MDEEEITARRVEAKKTAVRLFIFAMALLAVFVIAMFYRSAENHHNRGVKKDAGAVSTSKQAESKNSAKN